MAILSLTPGEHPLMGGCPTSFPLLQSYLNHSNWKLIKWQGWHISYWLFVVQSLSHVRLFVTPWTAACPRGLPVLHHLLQLAQTHVHWVSDAIQPSHPLSSPSPSAFNLSQHQGLFQWVSSLHQVAKVLEFQLQHQSFQWIFRTDFL